MHCRTPKGKRFPCFSTWITTSPNPTSPGDSWVLATSSAWSMPTYMSSLTARSAFGSTTPTRCPSSLDDDVRFTRCDHWSIRAASLTLFDVTASSSIRSKVNQEPCKYCSSQKEFTATEDWLMQSDCFATKAITRFCFLRFFLRLFTSYAFSNCLLDWLIVCPL